MKLKIIFSVNLLTLLFESAFARERIYGGYSIEITEAPYMVQVVRKHPEGGHSYCGGTILRRDLILTAAHCSYNKEQQKPHEAKHFKVYVGSAEKRGGTQHKVKHVYPHPEYMGQGDHFHHDIAILQLSTNIDLDEKSVVVELPDNDDNAEAGTEVLASGWGKNPQNPSDDELYQVKLKIVSAEECVKYHKDDEFDEHEICAGDEEHQSCAGDSGGPLIDIKTNHQVGIVSYSDGKCPSMEAKVFTRVTDNLKFVRQTMAQTSRRPLDRPGGFIRPSDLRQQKKISAT